MVRRFTLPETHAAYTRWCEITKLDETGDEWAEVYFTLEEAGLVQHDTCPQRSLFDDPDVPLGQTPGARKLQVAMVAGAYFARISSYDLVTSTALAATLMPLVASVANVDESALMLAGLLADQVAHVATSPGVALAWLVGQDLASGEYDDLSPALPRAVPQTLAEAVCGGHDSFALAVFRRMRHAFEITEMTNAYWAVTRVHPAR